MPTIPERIPPSVKLGSHYDSVIYAILMQEQTTSDDPLWFNPLNRGTVMGFGLPSWQREVVWSTAQQVSFIESVWRGIPLGTYTYNSVVHENPRYRGLLIDGLQRLHAIEWYVMHDAFRVFDLLYSELTKIEQRRFVMTKFCSYEFDSADEKELRAYYNLMNFGGTPHKENERA